MIDIFWLETSIKTKLETITNFKIVYDHFRLKTTWYPFASFELSDFDWVFADVCSNFRIITFNVVIIQVVNTDVDRDLAKQIIYKCLEQVIDKFDWDMTLSNTDVVRWDVLKWSMWTVLWQDWDSLALSVEVKLTVNNSII